MRRQSGGFGKPPSLLRSFHRLSAQLLYAAPSIFRICLQPRVAVGTAERHSRRRRIAIDDQHVFAQIELGSSSTGLPFSSNSMSAWAVFFLATSSSWLYKLSRSDSLMPLTAVATSPKIAQEDISPLAFLLHPQAAAEIHAQLPPDGLQRQPQFLLNFRIRGDRFFRFAGERHPHAGHVNHHRDRRRRQAAARLAQAIGPPVGLR